MKVLVIYYSHGGHTRQLANAISKAIGADVLELEMKKDIKHRQGFSKYLWGGKKVLFEKDPELLSFDKNPDDYDFLFIGTPTWVGQYNPIFKTFFKENTIKRMIGSVIFALSYKNTILNRIVYNIMR